MAEAVTSATYRPPSSLLAAAEAPRSLAEFAAAVASLPVFVLAPRGQGEPVIVLPGLGGGDGSTAPLRWFLRSLGYATYGWNYGRNVGRHAAEMAHAERWLQRVAEEHEDTVTLIGWSLGGVYARELAHVWPDLVSQVITLGSPHRLTQAEEDAWRNARALGRRHGRSRLPRFTAIYSRSDGVVPWEACLEEQGAYSESVGILGSHLGLGHNPAAWWVIADRLARVREVTGA